MEQRGPKAGGVEGNKRGSRAGGAEGNKPNQKGSRASGFDKNKPNQKNSRARKSVSKTSKVVDFHALRLQTLTPYADSTIPVSKSSSAICCYFVLFSALNTCMLCK